MMELFTKILEQQGLIAAILCAMMYFWRKDARQDYEGVCKRLNELEDARTEDQRTVIKESIKAVEANTAACGQVKEVLTQHQEIMRNCQNEVDRLRA